MKKITLFFSLFMLLNICSGQAIYEGLTLGMSKREAKKEFKMNNDSYTNVDLGNGFIWRLYIQNFFYEDGGLVGIWFTPKGSALGMSHQNTISYLEFTRSFFESKNYKVIFEPDYWQYPENFNAKYGLLLAHPDKETIIQLYPGKMNIGSSVTYMPNMKVFNYNWFQNVFQNDLKAIEEKQSNTGF